MRHDKFVDEIGVLSSKAHQNQRVLYGIAAAAVALALITYGTVFYRSSRERQAQVMLGTAIDTIESPLVPAQQPNQPATPPDPRARFKTEAERNTAAEKQFKDLQAKYS
ncbi:MAG: hypothetical protein ACXW29_04265, partial [Thermoanaerobaculia bacterium]